MAMTSERLPLETDRFLRALCADYDRRASLLRSEKAEPELRQVCLWLNRAIDEAAGEAYRLTQAYAPDFLQTIRRDIADCRGYAASPLSGVMAEGTYKKYKRMVKRGIAERMGIKLW